MRGVLWVGMLVFLLMGVAAASADQRDGAIVCLILLVVCAGFLRVLGPPGRE